MLLTLAPISPGSAAYREEVALLDRILRQPLGLRFSAADLEEEKDDLHFGAYAEGALVGCLLLRDIGHGLVKMRQVAVDDSRQGLGVGRFLVAAAELAARERGFLEMQLNARETAVAFYLRLGYEIIEAPFSEVGIPHRKMRKILAK